MCNMEIPPLYTHSLQLLEKTGKMFLKIYILLTSSYFVKVTYYVFHGRVTLFFANNFLTQRWITMKFLHNFF